MYIPFPERVPINFAAIFAAALFLIQMAEGTAIYFGAGCVVFILVSVFAFNAAGGLTRTSGAYVFTYATMAVLIGICYKAYLGEPAESNLQDPHTDIEVYVGGMLAMYGAVIVSRRLTRKSGLLQDLLKESAMPRASVGCMAFSVAGAFAIEMLGEAASGLQSAFAQLNQLMSVGIIIGVMYEIRRSAGRRSANLPVALGAAYSFLLDGIAHFSKQGLLAGLFCWLLPVCALQFRVSIAQMISFLAGLFIIFHYLVPYSQYGRDLVPEGATVSERLAVGIPLLEHADKTRRLYYEQENGIEQSFRGLNAYYNTPEGFWERLQMVSVDDKLNLVTDQGSVFGLLPIKLELINVIPHFIWPNKPGINPGNAYVHDINGEAQGEGDITTGISFSPTGEAYHLAKWTGVLVIAPLFWCILFIVFDILVGDLRASPWGLLALSMVTFIAPEGGLTGTIHLITFGTEVLVFCAFFATWIAPLLAIPLLGPDPRRNISRI